MFRVLLLVAIAFGRWAAASGGVAPLGVAVTVNAGETGVAAVFVKPTGVSITSVWGGGSYSLITSKTQGTIRGELWSTAAGAAVAASRLTAEISGALTQGALEGHFTTGVLSIGPSATTGNTVSNGSIGLATQDTNNWVAAFFGLDDGGAAPTAGIGNFRGTDQDASIIQASTDSTAASASVVTNSITKAAVTNWVALALELRSVPASFVYYTDNPLQGGSNAGLLTTTAPTASTSTTGWTVGTTGVNQYSRQTYNSEVPATGFTGTAQPSGTLVNLGEDAFRLSAVTSGTFSAGTWYSSASCIAVSSGGIQQGRARFRLWRSANADGTSATEITQGTMVGSQVTELNTSVAQTSSASTQISALTLTSEFLFQQVAWETL